MLVRAYAFTDYVCLAFDLVRENARGNPAVLRRLLRALALAASQVHERPPPRSVARSRWNW
ncbi:MAG: hypothetical protein WKG07_41500 [Hymenobacter sp.]